MKILKNDHGYTLLEVILTILILAVAVIPMLSMLTGLNKMIFKGRDNSSANDILLQAVEEIKATPYDNVQIIDDVTIPNYQGSKFTLSKTVKPITSTNSTLKQVYLKITDGNQKLMEFSFIIYKGGI